MATKKKRKKKSRYSDIIKSHYPELSSATPATIDLLREAFIDSVNQEVELLVPIRIPFKEFDKFLRRK